MRPDVYWIEAPIVGRLAIMPRPRAGDWLGDEVAGWRAEGIDMVVSLLEQEEIAELVLGREAELCRAQAIELVSFPIPDRGVPASLHQATALAQLLAAMLAEGKAVAVHCRAGIGRSSLIAACAHICAEIAADAAFAMIGKARRVTVPDTKEQVDWVVAFAKAV